MRRVCSVPYTCAKASTGQQRILLQVGILQLEALGAI